MPAPTCDQPMELDAALAVVRWKHEFARQLRLEAARLAGADSGNVEITLDHLRTALPAAMESTRAAIAEQPMEREDATTEAA